MSIDDFDVFACYQELWKTKSEKRNAMRQGIISNDSCTENCIKLKINTNNNSVSSAQDNTILATYGNKFIVPLNFEMLDSVIRYYQAGLGNRLCYKITFIYYNRVILSTGAKLDASYKISDISLNMKSLPTQISKDVSQPNTKSWLCCMTEFLGTDKFQ